MKEYTNKPSILVAILSGKPAIFLQLVKNEIPKLIKDNNVDVVIGISGKKFNFNKEKAEHLLFDHKISIPKFLKLYDFSDREWHFSKDYNSLIFNHLNQSDKKYDYLLLLNDDIVIKDENFIEKYINFSRLKNDKVLLGARTEDAFGNINHDGTIIADTFVINQTYSKFQKPEEKDNSFRKVPAITGAFMFMPASLYIDLKGFPEEYEFEAQDTAFCMEAILKGYKIYCSEWTVLVHYEVQSRQIFSNRRKSLDFSKFFKKYSELIKKLF